MGVRGLAAFAVIVRLLVGCSSHPIEYGCAPDSSLRIGVPFINRDAVITTKGACTDVKCVVPVDGGCTTWVGEMTSTDPTTSCEVRVIFGDGTSTAVATFPSDEFCRAPFGRGAAVTEYVPRDGGAK